ncbi:E3 ubiquitin-protein ligase hrd1 [Parahypoxylon ruwenzoriense]
MRLFWYAGTSTALAAGVIAYAFNQRANFYSAMVYLSQNNLSLMILINLVLLLYGSFVWGLQRLCYGPLRPVEIEQLYEKAWFAVTETCLAMTIFREEVGAWFLVMFTALVTGKVWEWIGEGRVEVLEQQPPVNPRLFHTRLSISLLLSVVYDTWLFTYTVNAVIQQARPNMMVMFLFEFAILATCSFRTGFRYVLSLVEADIVRKQTRQRLEDRRKQVREQRAEIMRRRESGDAVEAAAAEQEELPNEEDVDETDIEVPGWESKGQWVLSLDLLTDFVKLGIYSAFFAILMMFYGLPIHIMRDLFMTARSFVKRLSALMRYRKALQDMNKYPDATQEELSREDTCIICREEMRPWDPSAVGAVERSRPKKLPCGHILHFGCLKSWLERQQVCPTCRRSVTIEGAAPNGAAPGANFGGQPQAPGQPAPGDRAANAGQPGQARGAGNMRVFQLGPIRLGFAQGNAQNIHEMAQRLRLPLDVPPAPVVPTTPAPPFAANPHLDNNMVRLMDMQADLEAISLRIQQDMQALHATQAELQILQAMMAELNRLRQLQREPQVAPVAQHGQPGVNVQFTSYQPAAPQQPLPHFQPMTQIPPFPNLPRASTPTVTRHGGVPYSAAIPAGSPELPEGVVIPPGWSLLPLQRLDGQPSQSVLSTQQPVQQADPSGQQSQAADAVNGSAAATSTTAVHRPSNSRAGDFNPRNFEVPSGYPEEGPTQTSPQEQREPPVVAAPTPVTPNWGGAAQLFANGGASSSASANEAETKAEEASVPEGPHDQSSGDERETSTSSSEKGKAKAVTVEDAEDE